MPAGRNGTTDDAFARLIRDGKTDLSGSTYMRIRKIVGRLNEILPAVIPGLTLELTINSGEKYTAGKQVVCAELYSKREEKCFLMKYESDGTRRILFLLRYLIDLCCMSELCVFVDSLDSEIFEYLFGSLLAVMRGEIRGQLIFTSHNLHAMDELPRKDIVFTTLNPDNRYVRITGLEKKTGLREQYLQMNSLGSQ
ncbi:MAG: ATP-binding protein [Lachnospiraceae bacterium]|nr:ATP-binding protein [Lachnospiraceae bacterium]